MTHLVRDARRAVMIAHFPRDARGAVMIEFVIAFMPVLLMFLSGVQLALLGADALVVRHAAIAGARSAAVVLDDDPARYGGAARGELLGRIDAIRRAVALPMAAIAPSAELFSTPDPAAAPSVAAALGRVDGPRLAGALKVSVPATTQVVLPLAPGSNELAGTRVEDSATVTVRVVFDAPCLVPLARMLMCSPRPHADPDRKTILSRVKALAAEATMPRFAARYAYPSERAGGSP